MDAVQGYFRGRYVRIRTRPPGRMRRADGAIVSRLLRSAPMRSRKRRMRHRRLLAMLAENDRLRRAMYAPRRIANARSLSYRDMIERLAHSARESRLQWEQHTERLNAELRLWGEYRRYYAVKAMADRRRQREIMSEIERQLHSGELPC